MSTRKPYFKDKLTSPQYLLSQLNNDKFSSTNKYPLPQNSAKETLMGLDEEIGHFYSSIDHAAIDAWEGEENGNQKQDKGFFKNNIKMKEKKKDNGKLDPISQLIVKKSKTNQTINYFKYMLVRLRSSNENHSSSHQNQHQLALKQKNAYSSNTKQRIQQYYGDKMEGLSRQKRLSSLGSKELFAVKQKQNKLSDKEIVERLINGVRLPSIGKTTVNERPRRRSQKFTLDKLIF